MRLKEKNKQEKLIKAKKRIFEASYDKKSLISAICVFAVLLGVTLYSFISNLKTDEPNALMLILTIAADIIIGLLLAFKIAVKEEKINKIIGMVLLLAAPFLTVVMCESLNNLFENGFTSLVFWGNYGLFLTASLFIYALTGSFKWSVFITNPIFLGLSVTNYFVVIFRGTAFLPLDILAATTAAEVIGAYEYKLELELVFAITLLVLIYILAIRFKSPTFCFKFKLASRLVTGTVSIVIAILFSFTSFFHSFGIEPDFWNANYSLRTLGVNLNFASNLKYIKSPAPNGYKSDDVNSYVESVLNGETYAERNSTPNIICIMNEALSDLSVLGEFETNIDYMPFLKSLEENTVKGNLYVPSRGGGTANTEFEFLTGYSLSQLTQGSYPYVTNIKRPKYSLVSTLMSQGYSSFMLHPYYAHCWNRTEAYGNLGFQNFYSIEDLFNKDFLEIYNMNFYDTEKLQEYSQQFYPNENLFYRQYIKDKYNYKLLIENFENRDKSVPYFAFNVTMQNHGGYGIQSDNFEETVYLTSTSEEYPETNQYLSLVKESDDAFKELVDYFKGVKEPTVICMFGDHQPAVETEFTDEIMGIKKGDIYTKKQTQDLQTTQFYIWANYDIEEQYIERLSSNYLSSLLLKVANVKGTKYNDFLLELSKTLPVIDRVGYIDNKGNYYKWDDKSPYEDLIETYKKLQYNGLFDKEVNKNVFALNDYDIKYVDLKAE